MNIILHKLYFAIFYEYIQEYAGDLFTFAYFVWIS